VSVKNLRVKPTILRAVQNVEFYGEEQSRYIPPDSLSVL